MKFVFVGNRKFVLEEMLKQKLDIIEVFVVSNTHLANDISNMVVNSYKIVEDKKQLIDALEVVHYDCLISNGCPFILPVNKLKKAKYINIHPSYLPDLRGVDPVVGAMLYERDFGATCHYMDLGIDTGDIVSQVKIPFTKDLDIALAYQLSFMAEKEVFNLALKNNFEKGKSQENSSDLIYYKRNVADQTIDFSESNQKILSKVRAFNNKSQGVNFIINEYQFTCYNASIITNEYIKQQASKFDNLTVFLVYEDVVLIQKDNEMLKLSEVKGDLSKIKVNSKLEI